MQKQSKFIEDLASSLQSSYGKRHFIKSKSKRLGYIHGTVIPARIETHTEKAVFNFYIMKQETSQLQDALELHEKDLLNMHYLINEHTGKPFEGITDKISLVLHVYDSKSIFASNTENAIASFSYTFKKGKRASLKIYTKEITERRELEQFLLLQHCTLDQIVEWFEN